MPYQLGQEVLRSQPFSYVVIDDIISKVCDFCLISQDERSLKCCSKCKRIYFCQNSCLESAWKTYHKEECKCLRKIDPKNKIPQDIVRLMARIIFKLRKKGRFMVSWNTRKIILTFAYLFHIYKLFTRSNNQL